jgi:hypothetical protein
MTAFNFKVEDYKPSLLPENWYEMIITEAKIEETQKNLDGIDDSEKLTIRLQVINHPQLNGYKLKDVCNVKNSNEIAQRIGRERVAKYCEAMKIEDATDTSQLLNKPFMALVSIKYKDEFTFNVIKTFRPHAERDACLAQNKNASSRATNPVQDFDYLKNLGASSNSEKPSYPKSGLQKAADQHSENLNKPFTNDDIPF